MKVLITGGAGFVGSSLAVGLAARHPDWDLVALDNLRRRGSELTLTRLREAEVEFVHGDVRERSDVLAVEGVDAVVECSAEPAALAGVDGATSYVVGANLVGAYHCLELARRDGAQFVFMSTSRVYPYAALDALAFREDSSRYELEPTEAAGASPAGVTESFTLEGARTLYGATKLAGELLATEYSASFGIATVANRCGVIAGPWQMGKVDQGVFTHWLLAHYFGRELRYIGYDGKGKQVRDLMHVDDLLELIDDQLLRPAHWAGQLVNVGGGRTVSLSLRETTDLCSELTGRTLEVAGSGEDRPGDVRVYLSDSERLANLTDWRPRRDARTILEDTLAWIESNERAVSEAL